MTLNIRKFSGGVLCGCLWLIAGCSSTSSTSTAPAAHPVSLSGSAAIAAAMPPVPKIIPLLIRRIPTSPAPVRTNALITVSDTHITLILSNSLDFVNWTYLGVLTNGNFNLSLLESIGFVKAVVAAYPVLFSWTPSSDPADGYELLYSPDGGVNWLDYDLLPDGDQATEVLQYPAGTNYFTLSTYGTNGNFSAHCNTTLVIVPSPVLHLQ